MIVKQQIPEGVKRFVREQIQTVPKLEVLLLLHREQSRSFTVAEVANELGFENDTAREQLFALEAIGLIEAKFERSKFRYQPAFDESRLRIEFRALGGAPALETRR